MASGRRQGEQEHDDDREHREDRECLEHQEGREHQAVEHQAGQEHRAGREDWGHRAGPGHGITRLARVAHAGSRVGVSKLDRDGVSRRRRQTARNVAISALIEVDRGRHANEVLPALLAASTLDRRDRSFATELVYGALRMRRACDWLVDQFARGELDRSVRAAARLGAYQLAFMRVPSYAAVSATVEESSRRARGLLNVVLRRIGELVDAGPIAWPDVGTELSYPDWVIERLSDDLGRESALGALAQMNIPASMQARDDGYIQDPGSQAVCGVVAHWWENPAEVSGLPGPKCGHQPGSDGASRLEQGVGADDGRSVLVDMCAAPGGKATYLARHAPLVVACDISPRRADLVAANAARAGLSNVAVMVADASSAPLRPGSCGAALVDAPCSGLGVLRRRPDARWRVRPEDIGRLAQLQRRLLVSAAGLVAPGGLLAYSVCTLTREETAGVGEWLVGDSGPCAGWEVLPPPGPPWAPWGEGAILLPQSAGTDGMYLIGVRRRR